MPASSHQTPEDSGSDSSAFVCGVISKNITVPSCGSQLCGHSNVGDAEWDFPLKWAKANGPAHPATFKVRLTY